MEQYKVDFIIGLLKDKICPIHHCQMTAILPFIIGAEYRRDRYKCPYCECRADFVGNEIKTDKIIDTLIFISNRGEYPSLSLN